MSKKKALIFYISRYSGHYHAASAIEEGLHTVLSGKVEAEKVNALDYTNPILGKLINKAYLEVIKKKPELWGHIYDNPDVIKKTKKAREALHKFNMSKIRRLIDSFGPGAVFCTQAFPCGMVADYKRTCGKDVHLIGVLTDNAPHSYWLFDEVDHYVVPSEDTARALKDKGVSPDKIRVYGIPVDPKFCQEHDGAVLRSELGFSGEMPVVLVMGGSQGLGAMEAAVKSLLMDTTHGYQLVVITGSNKRLYRKLKKLQGRNGGIKVFSYVDNVNEFMEISDVVITKAGGMTLAEAMVKRLPMIIVDPIPGHERMNADFLVRHGVAIEAGRLEDIHEAINRLFDNPGDLEMMRKSTDKIRKPDSALDIARLMG